MGRLIEIRDAVWSRLLLDKTNLTFTLNTFSTERTFIPHERLTDLAINHPNGKVYVVSASMGDTVNNSRTHHGVTQEFPVHIGFQMADVDYDDLTAIEPLIDLVEELQDMCRLRVVLQSSGGAYYQFNRIEMMKDDSDVPFAFTMLREAATFEAYFTAVYTLTFT